MGISRRAYAQLRGVNESSVRRAIQAGRITPEPDGTIDPERADAEWRANTDPAKQRGAAASANVPNGAAQLIAAAVEKPASSSNEKPDTNTPFQPRAETMNLMAAKTANEVLRAKLQNLKLQQQKGMLVDREKTKSLVFDLARQERDAWLNWPPRVAANMAAELDVEPHLLEEVLNRYLRAHLEQIVGVKVEAI